MLPINEIHTMDCLQGLTKMSADSVQCTVTSPPYWRQRDYNHKGQLGQEPTPEGYINNLLAITAQIHRVLRPDGLFWLNLGDGFYHSSGSRSKRAGATIAQDLLGTAYQPKELIGLPWQVALAIRSQGWMLRQEIIWHKPNGMPESVKDRCTRNHEYIFMFSKQPDYYYDPAAIGQPLSEATLKDKRLCNPCVAGPIRPQRGYPGAAQQGSRLLRPNGTLSTDPADPATASRQPAAQSQAWANRRSVWTIAPKGFKGAHYATFPTSIPELCIRCSTRPGDLVLDPFMGAGTTALASSYTGRSYIGFEINPTYVKLAKNRLLRELGLFCGQPG
ncbi:site-specific DNA-methyltransferase [Chitinophaga parva]|uniref:Methyltransferase n=1 Tax=Chitinophaga parva TaxID=2169414 RepID=A0A2T7BLS0_9BACT|nr:site-specific DNA-methyltransferase [Chitinophaga parva]PUZ28571.1 site-specific DNA-methyltransferase [Chitinophaga parva]